MFVPRALRLKGVKEKRKSSNNAPTSAPMADTAVHRDDALVEAMEKTRTASPAPQQQRSHGSEVRKVAPGPRFTTTPVTALYIAQLAAGVELIFTDYAHHEETRSSWLKQHYRNLPEGDNFVHLSAILEHPNISMLKPETSQKLLQQALREHPSKILEISENGYHLRRIPSSYPSPFLPEHSFNVVNDDGLTFWDQRTIYVEPHLRNLCQTPARLAHWLTEHGGLKSKWLPVQAVHTLWNSCAFIVISGNVMNDDVWQKWRAKEKPEDWKIMTKAEHTRRTAEYVALLKKQNPRGMRKNSMDDSELPAIAKPATLAMNAEIVPAYSGSTGNAKTGRKRKKRKKTTKTEGANGDAEAEQTDNGAEEAEQKSEQLSNKRRA